jgi:predicted RNase H-like HicB family nuclease
MTSKVFDPTLYRMAIQSVDIEGERLLKATVRDLPDVAVFGYSYDEVAKQVLDVIARLHQAAVDHGRPFPKPSESSEAATGRVTLRLPRSLHAEVEACAQDDDVSLNTWIVSALSDRVGRRATRTTLDAGLVSFRNNKFVGVIVDERVTISQGELAAVEAGSMEAYTEQGYMQ